MPILCHRAVFRRTALSSVALLSATVAFADDINLSVMIWDPAQTTGVQLAIDAFEAANPGISVALDQLPPDQFYTRLDGALSAGEGPDVMWQSSRATFYVDGGALRPLDEFIRRDGLDLSDYNPTITQLYNIGGSQYGVPKDFDARVVIYNANVFEELGVTAPSAGWTWDDMVRIASELEVAQTGATDVPLFYEYNFNSGIASLIQSMGGAIVADGIGAVPMDLGAAALEMIRGLQEQGLIVPVADSGDLNPVNGLISGTIAMATIPSWNLSLLSRADVPEGTFHAVTYPAVDGSWMTDTNGLAYVMNANTRHPEEAWSLIRFLTSDEGALLHAQGGAGLPANNGSEPLTAFVAANQAIIGLEEALADQQLYLRTTTAHPASIPGIRQIHSSVMPRYYAGEITAEETVTMINEMISESMAQ